MSAVEGVHELWPPAETAAVVHYFIYKPAHASLHFAHCRDLITVSAILHMFCVIQAERRFGLSVVHLGWFL